MKAKKKPAVRMKPAMRAMRDGWKSKDDQIVELGVQIAVVGEKVNRLLEEVLKWRTEAEVAKAKLATLEEEKNKQVAIVPETGLTLWEKAGDDMIAIVVKPRGPADVDSAKDPHQLEVEVTKYQIIN